MPCRSCRAPEITLLISLLLVVLGVDDQDYYGKCGDHGSKADLLRPEIEGEQRLVHQTGVN